LRRWVTGLEVTGELVEVAAVEFEEVVARRRSRRGGHRREVPTRLRRW
jgi:hypothetical protein